MKNFQKIFLLVLLSLSLLFSSCKVRKSSPEGWYGEKPLQTLEDKLIDNSITDKQDTRESLADLMKSINESSNLNGYNSDSLSVCQDLEKRFTENNIKSTPSDVLMLYNGYMQSLKACSKYSDIPAIASKMITYMDSFMKSGVSESTYSRKDLNNIISYYMNCLDWVFYHVTDMDEALSKADFNVSTFLSGLLKSYGGYFNEISEFAYCDSLLKKSDFKTLKAKTNELIAKNEDYLSFVIDYNISCEFALGETQSAIKRLEDYYFAPYIANTNDSPDFTKIMSIIYALSERNAISKENYKKLFTDSKFGVGIRVTGVTEQGQKNGFMTLDIIVDINGGKIITPYMMKQLMSDSVGKDITVNVIRNYVPKKLTVKNTNGVLGVASLSSVYRK